jgi:hypothetical protein
MTSGDFPSGLSSTLNNFFFVGIEYWNALLENKKKSGNPKSPYSRGGLERIF